MIRKVILGVLWLKLGVLMYRDLGGEFVLVI